MGWIQITTAKNGRISYKAYYRDIKGKTQYEGAYTNEDLANKAWQRAEARIADGRLIDTKSGKSRFKDYVLKTWFPNHVIEQTTRDDYDRRIHKYLIPWFGNLRMNQIFPQEVRAWVTWMSTELKVSPSNLSRTMSPLGAIFTTALNDGIIFLHPCKGIRLPTIPDVEKSVLSVDQFDGLYSNIDDYQMKMLLETDIQTGLRWGELTELRAKDWISAKKCFKVSRTVVKVRPDLDPDGYSYRVKLYPKGKKSLVVKVQDIFAEKVDKYLDITGKSGDDLLFTYEVPEPVLRVIPHPSKLGLTAPNSQGRRYQHGTTTAYHQAKCRCEFCRAAYAQYRRERRSSGLDLHDSKSRRKRGFNPEGHVPGWWFREHFWRPALKSSDIKEKIRIHDLRATHISWLLAGGADLEEVRDRVGHKSVVTTSKYVRSLKGNSDKTLDAFQKIRGTGSGVQKESNEGESLARTEFEEMSMDELLHTMSRLQTAMSEAQDR